MNYNEFKKNTHDAIKIHFENFRASNFDDMFLKKVYNAHKQIYSILDGETVVFETRPQRDFEKIRRNVLEYVNLHIKDESYFESNERVASWIVNKVSVLLDKGIINDELRFEKPFEDIRKGQKLSKFLQNSFNNLDEKQKLIFNNSTSKIIESIESEVQPKYIRLSCAMNDYLKLGFQLQSSCTVIYSDYANYVDYAKAPFTYAQLPTIVGLMYNHKADALDRSNNALVRQVMYFNDDGILGMRKYGHSKEYKELFSEEVFNFFKDKELANDYKYLTNLKNRKVVNYSKVALEMRKQYPYITNTSTYGYIDTFHYGKSAGSLIFYNLDYQGLELQKSIFDDNYDFKKDNDGRLNYNQSEVLERMYKSLSEELKLESMIAPYHSSTLSYKKFLIDEKFYSYVHEENLLERAASIEI